MIQDIDSYMTFDNYQILRMCKVANDYKKDLLDDLSGMEIQSDYVYEVFWTILGSIIQKIRIFNSEDYQDQLLFIRDIRIDEYFKLVFEHSNLTGQHEQSNPYYMALLKAIDESLNFSDHMYDYGFRHNKKTYKSCRILLDLHSDFTCYFEIIEGMIKLMNFLEESTEKLKTYIEIIKSTEVAA